MRNPLPRAPLQSRGRRGAGAGVLAHLPCGAGPSDDGRDPGHRLGSVGQCRRGGAGHRDRRADAVPANGDHQREGRVRGAAAPARHLRGQGPGRGPGRAEADGDPVAGGRDRRPGPEARAGGARRGHGHGDAGGRREQGRVLHQAAQPGRGGATEQRAQFPQPHAPHAQRRNRAGPGWRRAHRGGTAWNPQQRLGGWSGLQQPVLRGAAGWAATAFHLQPRRRSGSGRHGGWGVGGVRPLGLGVRERNHQIRHKRSERLLALLRQV